MLLNLFNYFFNLFLKFITYLFIWCYTVKSYYFYLNNNELLTYLSELNINFFFKLFYTTIILLFYIFLFKNFIVISQNPMYFYLFKFFYLFTFFKKIGFFSFFNIFLFKLNKKLSLFIKNYWLFRNYINKILKFKKIKFSLFKQKKIILKEFFNEIKEKKQKKKWKFMFFVNNNLTQKEILKKRHEKKKHEKKKHEKKNNKKNIYTYIIKKYKLNNKKKKYLNFFIYLKYIKYNYILKIFNIFFIFFDLILIFFNFFYKFSNKFIWIPLNIRLPYFKKIFYKKK